MRGHYKDGILKACDEACGKKRGRRSKGDTWWWNEEMKEADKKKKDVHEVTCQNSTEENKRMHKCMKNKAKKAVSEATREG